MTEKLFQILINNRNYSSYEIMDANKFDKVVLDIIDPFKHKLFTNDIFTVNSISPYRCFHIAMYCCCVEFC